MQILFLDATAWSPMDIIELGVDILIPVSIFFSGWYVNKQLKKLEHSQWANQKLIEKRLELYETIAPKLNDLFCFYTWIGDWKELSPADIVATKRELDKAVHVNRNLLGNEFFHAYQAFMTVCFVPWGGAGHDARIRSVIVVPGHGSNRKNHGRYTWQEEWEKLFAEEKDVSTKHEVEAAYYRAMQAFSNTLGIITES